MPQPDEICGPLPWPICLAQPTPEQPLMVALSGGVDSVVLLHLVTQQFGAAAVHAVHVHHQLQAAADAWPAFCAELCARLGVRLAQVRVSVTRRGGESLEACARLARYQAIAAEMRKVDASILATAHHADDHLETVLLQLFRGCALSGLRGLLGHDAAVLADSLDPAMSPGSGLDQDRLHQAASNLLPWPVSPQDAEPASGMAAPYHLDATRPALALWRPLLAHSRANILKTAHNNGWRWVEDPSNADVQHRRNLLRVDVIPRLDAAFPQWRHGVMRLAEAAVGQRETVVVRWQTLKSRVLAEPGVLDVAVWYALSADDRDMVVEAWLREAGHRPGRGVVKELSRQLEHGLQARRGGRLQLTSNLVVEVRRQRAVVVA